MTDLSATQRETLAWNCRCSDQPTTLEVIDRWPVGPEGDEDFDPFENIVAKCRSCKTAYVLRRDGVQTFTGWEMTPYRQVHPEDRQPLPFYVPASIRDSHDEAVRCVGVRAYTAATIMARRGVEAICADHHQSKGTLAAKLTALKKEGIIDDRLHDWSEVIRDLGNSGAHDVDVTLNREDADDAIAFFEALVNYLYTFRQRYETHLRRKSVEKDMRELI
jgi:hypothetical protein